MNTATFGTWLRGQRKAHGYSQEELGDVIGVHRTYITQLERRNNEQWPAPETRAKFHAVFGTTDDDLVDAGVAVRIEYPRPRGGSRVVYESAMRRGETPSQPAIEVPADVVELLAQIEWTDSNADMVAKLLGAFIDDNGAGVSPSARRGTPAESRRVTARPPHTSRRR